MIRGECTFKKLISKSKKGSGILFSLLLFNTCLTTLSLRKWASMDSKSRMIKTEWVGNS